MFTRALMVAAGLMLMSVVDSDAVAEDTSGGLGAAAGLDLCSHSIRIYDRARALRQAELPG